MTIPPPLQRPFRILAFDWDGTAVSDRREDASALREGLIALLEAGVTLVIVTGTHLDNVVRQLGITGRTLPRGRLYAATNRGSEVHAFDESGQAELVSFRQASHAENAALDRAAARLQQALSARTGLTFGLIADRLNRRKIDLIPLPAWHDPPKARIAELLEAVNGRFRQTGLPEGLQIALTLARQIASEEGLPDARITTDVKHIEIGLTDKANTMAWVLRVLAPALGVSAEEILVGGDEFAPIAGDLGSDSQMRIPEASLATFFSVGREPRGVPLGVIALGGGPERFREILADQLQRALPAPPTVFVPTMDARWLLVEERHVPAAEHEVESRFALSNGYSGSRGSLMEGSPHSRSGTFLAGVFDPGPAGFPELVIAPFWAALGIETAGEPLRLDAGEVLLHRRMLDMRRGMLLRVWRHRSPEGRVTRIHEARWASLSDRHAFVQRVWLMPDNYAGRIVLTGTLDGRIRDLEGDMHLAPAGTAPTPLLVTRTRHTGIAIAQAGGWEAHPPAPPPEARTGDGWVGLRWQQDVPMDDAFELKRWFALFTGRDGPEPERQARSHLDRLADRGVLELERQHTRIWRERWEEADLRLEGDEQAQRALRFALYHLIGAVNPDDPHVSVGARALTGEGYKGHVFWDTEIYMLPFYLHTHPPAAKALLMYRYHALDAARERARALGCQGALYAWESADSGEDVTPESVIGLDGTILPIRTGGMAHHVASAVGHAVWRYWLATGDDAFMQEAGAEILMEVARFWASRAEPDDSGRCHLRHVIGPDEYHEDVDDNAYTNVMAQWILDRAVQLHDWLQETHPPTLARLTALIGLAPAEPSTWREIARDLVTGFDQGRGIHEQFAGYFALDDLDLDRTAGPFVPGEVLLGRPRLQGGQVIKQADVVLLMLQLWDRFPAAVRQANYRYYEPRTAHGSSLSPGSYALAAARLGEVETARRYFHFTAAIDLDDRMGNASEGVHAAALGCLWQVAVFGFAGLHVHERGLAITPNLPETWRTLEFPFRYRQQRLRIHLSPEKLTIDCPEALDVALGEADFQTLAGGRHVARSEGGAWQWLSTTSP